MAYDALKAKLYRDTHKEYFREYRRRYSKKRKLAHQKWCAANRDKINLKARIWQEKHKHPCLDCGKLIRKASMRCRACAQSHLSGSNSGTWRGGKYRKHGYNYIRIDKKYIQEHRYIWEFYNNKKIPEGWVIHHLNGIRDDNRIKNLIALPSKKHRFVLAAKAKRIQELEAILKSQGHLF